MQIEFRVGTQTLADGTQVPPRLGRQGGVVTDDGHARYYEMAYRTSIGESNSYVSSTGTAGVAPGTVLSTTPPFALWNPANSGKNLYIIRTAMGIVSGTFGLGQMWYGYVNAQNTKPTGGTALANVSTCIGVTSTGVGQAFQASTVAAIPTILRPSPWNWALYASASATVLNPQWSEEIGGNIMVMPGNVFVMQAVAGAGTSPLVSLSCEWGEEKI